MPCVVLQPLLDDALDAVHEVITKAVVTMSTRINAKRFILWYLKIKKGFLNGVVKTVCRPVQRMGPLSIK
jgi:hypothetical protein